MFNYLTTFIEWYGNANKNNLSMIDYGEEHTLTPKDFTELRGCSEVYSESLYIDIFLYKEYIVKYKAGFYVYLSRPDFETKTFKIKILYKPEQYNEVLLFLRQLKKIKK
jgi:hypothetical protein